MVGWLSGHSLTLSSVSSSGRLLGGGEASSCLVESVGVSNGVWASKIYQCVCVACNLSLEWWHME